MVEFDQVFLTVGNAVGVLGMAAFLIYAVIRGHLVSGASARQTIESQQAVIDRLLAQNEALLEAARVTVPVVAALPTVAEVARQAQATATATDTEAPATVIPSRREG